MPLVTLYLSKYSNFFLTRTLHASQLLGRTVDLSTLIAQRMNESLLRALKLAISRFECGNLTGVMVGI